MRRFFVVIAAVLILGTFLYASVDPITPSDRPQEFIPIFIPKGAPLPQIAAILEENNLVWSAGAFRVWAAISGHAEKLKPGRYHFPSSVSLFALARELREGPRDIVFRITPGESVREVEERLVSLGLAKPKDLLGFDASRLRDKHPWIPHIAGALTHPLEGFLFPDSYHFYPGESIEEMMDAMLQNFHDKVLLRLTDRATISRTVTIASLIEREVKSPAEKRLVAGIIEKRLTAGVPLQIDATVLYLACRGYTRCPALTKDDYTMDSPYNSYAHRGLPPGPIANPSLNAIEAAQDPAESPYWYYLTDFKTGTAIFSKTFDEHQRNRATYLLR